MKTTPPKLGTVTVRTFTHNWNEKDRSYDRAAIPSLPNGFWNWAGASTRSFSSVAGAKRSIRASKEQEQFGAEFVITEERFVGRESKPVIQVWVSCR